MTTEYRPHRYVMQDITHVYVGCKFTLQDVLNFEDAPFKLKSVIRKFFLNDASQKGDTVLADYLFEVDPNSEAYDVLCRMKAKVKFTAPKSYVEDKGYKNETLSYQEFRERQELKEHIEQVYVEEISLSKLGLLALG